MYFYLTLTDGALTTVCILAGILFIAWLWHIEDSQKHESTPGQEIPSNETKTQQEAGNEP